MLPPDMDTIATICRQGGTVTLDPAVGTFPEMDQWSKDNGLTVTYGAWHLNPEYRCFLTNPQWPNYPSGLVLVNDQGKPQRFSATP